MLLDSENSPGHQPEACQIIQSVLFGGRGRPGSEIRSGGSDFISGAPGNGHAEIKFNPVVGVHLGRLVGVGVLDLTSEAVDSNLFRHPQAMGMPK